MLNQKNISYQQNGLSVIPRVYPVSMVQPVNGAEQHSKQQSQPFVVGKIYQGQIVDKLNNDVYLVKMENSFVKMPLGDLVHVGQSVPFKFIQNQPSPTFLLLQHPHQEIEVEFSESDGALLKTISDGVVLSPQANASQAANLKLVQNQAVPIFNLPNLSAYSMEEEVKFSSTAQLINQFFQDAKSEGADGRYQAIKVVSEQPMHPQLLAKELKQAISQSGIFYESHLRAFVLGHKSLEAIRQEPQNRMAIPIANLVSQQLDVLEHQRFAWTGEIWPHQQAQLDIYKETPFLSVQDYQGTNAHEEDEMPIKSEMTLHLPNLGKVTAKLSLANGRLSVNILAESADTTSTLKNHQQNLANALQKNGQALDGLIVNKT